MYNRRQCQGHRTLKEEGKEEVKRGLVASIAATVAAASLILTACGGGAPAAPTQAPSKPAEPTKAAAPAGQPTTAPAAQPTAAPAAKANWPEKGKSITLIVGSDAGGSSDVGARLIAPGMEKELGVPVNVVNKPGAGWQVGLTELANAKPDGYTFGMTVMPQTNTIYLDPDRKAVFSRKSFAPVGMQVVDPGVIAVKSDSKYKTLKDLIDDAKANPGKIKATTTGILGDDHLNLLRTQKAAGVQFAVVHFTGGAPSITSLLGGHVDVNFNNVGDYMSQVKAGTVRILAVTDAQRSKFYPDVPTVDELGFKGLYSASSRGMSAPANTPKEALDALASAFKKASENPDYQAKMAEQALTVRSMSPAEMGKYWDDMDAQLPDLMAAAKAETGATKGN